MIRLEARLPITAARFVWLQLISGAFPLENFETCFCPMSPTHTTSLGAYKTPAADSEEAPLHGLHAATHQPVINPRKCERPVLVFVINQVFSTPMRRTTQDLTTVELCSPCSLGSNEFLRYYIHFKDDLDYATRCTQTSIKITCFSSRFDLRHPNTVLQVQLLFGSSYARIALHPKAHEGHFRNRCP